MSDLKCVQVKSNEESLDGMRFFIIQFEKSQSCPEKLDLFGVMNFKIRIHKSFI